MRDTFSASAGSTVVGKGGCQEPSRNAKPSSTNVFAAATRCRSIMLIASSIYSCRIPGFEWDNQQGKIPAPYSIGQLISSQIHDLCAANRHTSSVPVRGHLPTKKAMGSKPCSASPVPPIPAVLFSGERSRNCSLIGKDVALDEAALPKLQFRALDMHRRDAERPSPP